jgi:hypothetical protein
MKQGAQSSGVKSALLPLALLWLAVHAVLLAVILGAKFLFTKTVLIALLVMGSLAFLFSRFQAKPRRLSHNP